MSGLLAVVEPLAHTPTTVYTCPENNIVALTIRAVNKTENPVEVSISLHEGTNPGNENFIEYQTTVSGKAILENTAIILKEDQKITVSCNSTGVNFIIWGIEEEIL